MSGNLRLLGWLLVVAAAGQALDVPQGMVGRWRPLKTTDDGSGAVYEFHADGRFDYSEGAVVESTWKLENGVLTMPPSAEGLPDTQLKVEFAGNDKIRLSDPKVPAPKSKKEAAATPQGDVLTRRGGTVDAKNPILGEWGGIHDLGSRKVESIWIFYAGGKDLLIMPFSTQHGKFTVKDGVMRLEFATKQPQEMKISVSGDELVFDGEKYARY